MHLFKTLLLTILTLSTSFCSQETTPEEQPTNTTDEQAQEQDKLNPQQQTTISENPDKETNHFEKSWLIFITLGLMYLCTSRVNANPGNAVNQCHEH